MRRLSILCVHALCLFIFWATSAQSQTEAKLSVGVSVPLSGPMAPFGDQIVKGMDLVLAELRQDDPRLARLISTVKMDDQGLEKKATEVAKELFRQKRVNVILGSFTSSASRAIANEAKEVKKPIVIPSVTTSSFAHNNPFVFRACLDDAQMGTVLAGLARDILRKKTAQVIYEQGSLYGDSVTKAFKTAFEKNGGKVAPPVLYPAGTKDFTEFLKQIAAAKPDLVLAPVYYPDLAKILEAAKAQGIAAPFVGPDSWDSSALKEIDPKILSGNYYAAHFNVKDPTKDTADFVSRYRGLYGQEPTVFSAMGYDGMRLIVDAFARAKSSLGPALTRELGRTTKAPSTMGQVAIDADRETVKKAAILTTTANGIKFMARLAPAE